MEKIFKFIKNNHKSLDFSLFIRLLYFKNIIIKKFSSRKKFLKLISFYVIYIENNKINILNDNLNNFIVILQEK